MRGSRVIGSALVFACTFTGVALAALTPVPLSARVIQAGEFPRFVAHAPPTLYRTPKQWVSVGALAPPLRMAQITRLRDEGFVAVASRQLGTPKREPWGGLSWAMQLRSAAAARAELVAQIKDTILTAGRPGAYTPFAVSGIPGARGYRLASPPSTGYDVQFADGPFVYLVGFGWSGNPADRPTRAELMAAAARLYQRVHGHPSH